MLISYKKGQLFSYFIGTVVLSTFLFVFLILPVAEARIGGGKSSGSIGGRSMGSRSYSAPSSSSFRSRGSDAPYMRSNTPYGQRPPFQQPQAAPQPSQTGGFFKSMAAGLAGGFLGTMLFQNLGFANNHNVAANGGGAATTGNGVMGGSSGGSSGFGLLGLLLVIGAGFLIYKLMSQKKRPALVGQNEYKGSSYEPSSPSYSPSYSRDHDDDDHHEEYSLEDQINRLKDRDPSFDPKRFKETSMDHFFLLQAAWMNRDLDSLKNLVEGDLYRTLESDCNALKSEGRINKVENIAVRECEIVEVNEENSYVNITIKFLANLLDYTIDEKSGDVVLGNKTMPVKFEEYWTYTRLSRGGSRDPWKLSAIQQSE